jgi:hypothetical protein
MKKGLLFLSAAITIFILVFLATVMAKVRAGAPGESVSILVPTDTHVPENTATQADPPTIQPTDTEVASPTISQFISPQEAAFIASAMLGNTKVYSVDTVTRYGMDVYQVTFSSGSIVFVSPQGHILTVTSLNSYIAPPTQVQEPDVNTHSASPSPRNDDPGGDD